MDNVKMLNIKTPSEAIEYINKTILENYQYRPLNKSVLEEIKAYTKSMLNDFERSGIICTHDIEVVQDPNDPTHILIREPNPKEFELGNELEAFRQLVIRGLDVDPDQLYTHPLTRHEYQQKIENYDLLVTTIRNILTDAGIPDHEEYPDEDVDDHEKSLRTGGRMIPLDKRVQMLAERYRNVVNLSKASYVRNPADKNAKIKNTIEDNNE